jgi:hypothetical protein
MHKSWRFLAALLLLLALGVAGAAAEEFGKAAFRRVWERTDYPIQQGVVERSLVWGPEPFTPVLNEVYANSPAGHREVQYNDKSRMEINNPDRNTNNPWYVTNGLLVNEMIEGEVQVGDSLFIPLDSEPVPIAGDPDNTYPYYRSLIRIYRVPGGDKLGDHITRLFLPEGTAVITGYAADPAVEIVRLEQGFGIPRAFWDFMSQRGTIYQNDRYVQNQQLFDWLFVLGYPTTDAYWTRVKVGGVERDVLFQAFERRLLTYTPANEPAWRVEMGNVGRHYSSWRYVNPFLDGKQAIITRPMRGEPPQIVEGPLRVQGFENGNAFEASITIRLKTSSGAVLAQQPTMVQRPDIGIAGPFDATLNYTQPAQTTPGVIEVVVFSPKDGAPTLLDSVAVVIKGAND